MDDAAVPGVHELRAPDSAVGADIGADGVRLLQPGPQAPRHAAFRRLGGGGLSRDLTRNRPVVDEAADTLGNRAATDASHRHALNWLVCGWDLRQTRYRKRRRRSECRHPRNGRSPAPGSAEGPADPAARWERTAPARTASAARPPAPS